MKEIECPDDVLITDTFENRDQEVMTIVDYTNNFFRLMRIKKEYPEVSDENRQIVWAINTRKRELTRLKDARFVENLERIAKLESQRNIY